MQMLLNPRRSAMFRVFFRNTSDSDSRPKLISPSSPVAKVAFLILFFPCAAPTANAHSFFAQQAGLLRAFPGAWVDQTTGLSSASGSFCACRRFLFTPSARNHLPRTVSISVREKNILPETRGEMQALESPSATTAAGDPLAQSSSSIGNSDPLVQYVVLRRDLGTKLKWSLGAIVAQACHAAVEALGLAMAGNEQDARRYLADGSNMRTVVLQVSSERELLKLRDKLTEHQIGHTLWQEEPEKIPTALASVPIRKTVGKVFEGLKLLS